MGSQDRVRFADGAAIFTQGSVGDKAFIVRTGKVRIFRVGEGQRETSLTTLGPGEMFGEMSLLERKPRSASAQAVGDTEVEALSEAEFERLAGDPAVVQILKKMSARIREVDDALEKLSVEGAKRRESLSQIGIRRSQFT
ncbi:MAG TPA: cyclic nucleotide-binding domain-containing protein [Coriobacteriia bacterium]